MIKVREISRRTTDGPNVEIEIAAYDVQSETTGGVTAEIQTEVIRDTFRGFLRSSTTEAVQSQLDAFVADLVARAQPVSVDVSALVVRDSP